MAAPVPAELAPLLEWSVYFVDYRALKRLIGLLADGAAGGHDRDGAAGCHSRADGAAGGHDRDPVATVDPVATFCDALANELHRVARFYERKRDWAAGAIDALTSSVVLTEDRAPFTPRRRAGSVGGRRRGSSGAALEARLLAEELSREDAAAAAAAGAQAAAGGPASPSLQSDHPVSLDLPTLPSHDTAALPVSPARVGRHSRSRSTAGSADDDDTTHASGGASGDGGGGGGSVGYLTPRRRGGSGGSGISAPGGGGGGGVAFAHCLCGEPPEACICGASAGPGAAAAPASSAAVAAAVGVAGSDDVALTGAPLAAHSPRLPAVAPAAALGTGVSPGPTAVQSAAASVAFLRARKAATDLCRELELLAHYVALNATGVVRLVDHLRAQVLEPAAAAATAAADAAAAAAAASVTADLLPSPYRGESPSPLSQQPGTGGRSTTFGGGGRGRSMLHGGRDSSASTMSEVTAAFTALDVGRHGATARSSPLASLPEPEQPPQVPRSPITLAAGTRSSLSPSSSSNRLAPSPLGDGAPGVRGAARSPAGGGSSSSAPRGSSTAPLPAAASSVSSVLMSPSRLAALRAGGGSSPSGISPRTRASPFVSSALAFAAAPSLEGGGSSAGGGDTPPTPFLNSLPESAALHGRRGVGGGSGGGGDGAGGCDGGMPDFSLDAPTPAADVTPAAAPPPLAGALSALVPPPPMVTGGGSVDGLSPSAASSTLSPAGTAVDAGAGATPAPLPVALLGPPPADGGCPPPVTPAALLELLESTAFTGAAALAALTGDADEAGAGPGTAAAAPPPLRFLTGEDVGDLLERARQLRSRVAAIEPTHAEWASTVAYTIGVFDTFHRGHANLLSALRSFGGRVVVGVHTCESIEQLKGRAPVQPLGERLEAVAPYVDATFIVAGTDPTPFIQAAVDPADLEAGRCVYVRGDDMPSFPARAWVEAVMPVVLLPRTPDVSSSFHRLLYHNNSSSGSAADAADGGASSVGDSVGSFGDAAAGDEMGAPPVVDAGDGASLPEDGPAEPSQPAPAPVVAAAVPPATPPRAGCVAAAAVGAHAPLATPPRKSSLSPAAATLPPLPAAAAAGSPPATVATSALGLLMQRGSGNLSPQPVAAAAATGAAETDAPGASHATHYTAASTATLSPRTAGGLGRRTASLPSLATPLPSTGPPGGHRHRHPPLHPSSGGSRGGDGGDRGSREPSPRAAGEGTTAAATSPQLSVAVTPAALAPICRAATIGAGASDTSRRAGSAGPAPRGHSGAGGTFVGTPVGTSGGGGGGSPSADEEAALQYLSPASPIHRMPARERRKLMTVAFSPLDYEGKPVTVTAAAAAQSSTSAATPSRVARQHHEGQ